MCPSSEGEEGAREDAQVGGQDGEADQRDGEEVEEAPLEDVLVVEDFVGLVGSVMGRLVLV